MKRVRLISITCAGALVLVALLVWQSSARTRHQAETLVTCEERQALAETAFSNDQVEEAARLCGLVHDEARQVDHDDLRSRKQAVMQRHDALVQKLLACQERIGRAIDTSLAIESALKDKSPETGIRALQTFGEELPSDDALRADIEAIAKKTRNGELDLALAERIVSSRWFRPGRFEETPDAQDLLGLASLVREKERVRMEGLLAVLRDADPVDPVSIRKAVEQLLDGLDPGDPIRTRTGRVLQLLDRADYGRAIDSCELASTGDEDDPDACSPPPSLDLTNSLRSLIDTSRLARIRQAARTVRDFIDKLEAGRFQAAPGPLGSFPSPLSPEDAIQGPIAHLREQLLEFNKCLEKEDLEGAEGALSRLSGPFFQELERSDMNNSTRLGDALRRTLDDLRRDLDRRELPKAVSEAYESVRPLLEAYAFQEALNGLAARADGRLADLDECIRDTMEGKFSTARREAARLQPDVRDRALGLIDKFESAVGERARQVQEACQDVLQERQSLGESRKVTGWVRRGAVVVWRCDREAKPSPDFVSALAPVWREQNLTVFCVWKHIEKIGEYGVSRKDAYAVDATVMAIYLPEKLWSDTKDFSASPPKEREVANWEEYGDIHLEEWIQSLPQVESLDPPGPKRR